MSCQILELGKGSRERERVGEKGCPLLGLAAVTGVLPVQSDCTGRGKYAERERERDSLLS